MDELIQHLGAAPDECHFWATHSGAELEQVVAAALYSAFAAGRDLSDTDLAEAIQDTVPLYETYEERIKDLRNWARHRARPATLDGKVVSWFQE